MIDVTNTAATGLASLNGQPVVYIDGIPTILHAISGNSAKASIVLNDLTTRPCYVVKVGSCFAHGETLKEATEDAEEKMQAAWSLEERIEAFIREHKSKRKQYDGHDLYKWHGLLTGSCRMGRTAWCKEHDMDPDTTKLTVGRFLKLTANSFGGDVIRDVAKRMGIQL